MRLPSLLLLAAAAIGLGSCGSSPTQPTTLTVSSIAPNSGTTLGGTSITITGSNFSAGATVTVGGVSATSVTVSGPTTITAVTAQRAAGPADVVVTAGGKTGSLAGGFSYVSPAATTNAPPVIGLLSARGTRPNQPVQFADLDEVIDVSAVVADAETPGTELTYEWSSNAIGTFIGTGPVVRWRAPLTPPLVPINVSLTLIVIERYASVDGGGLPVTRENRAEKNIQVSVHDSKSEISAMARDFLLDFTDSRITDLATILRNFTDDIPACASAKLAEGNEIDSNRQNYTIDLAASTVGTPVVTFNFQGLCPVHTVYGDACALVPVDWRSIRKPTGQPEHVRGTDQLSAVYLPAQGRWRLCGSDFDGVTLANGNHRFIR
ncbi:MAG: IPT/TIG domain-containing protein [Acidobacteriota bacterium]